MGAPPALSGAASTDFTVKLYRQSDQSKPYLEFAEGENTQFTIRQLLELAEITLDDVSKPPAKATLRTTGVILLLAIDYTSLPIGASISKKILCEGTMYVLDREKLDVLTYRDRFDLLKITNRLARRGVEFAVLQSGKIGRFNFQFMFVNLVAAFAIIQLSAHIVDAVFFNLDEDLQEIKYMHHYVKWIDWKEGFVVDEHGKQNDNKKENYVDLDPDLNIVFEDVEQPKSRLDSIGSPRDSPRRVRMPSSTSLLLKSSLKKN
eukprot:NODE_2171_length_972_cov_86.364030_g1784_i0.p1 GENE.NODE_2171_length_972_cov_86.364030_g1784_i0~~NODE_2171_length_972_cov_86.364030_g1784_i0.p1  ORF type:complete len:269 (+),score=71.18 NODE_2171_length_972_cov_86.364030_g1784_i0:22-807(+)